MMIYTTQSNDNLHRTAGTEERDYLSVGKRKMKAFRIATVLLSLIISSIVTSQAFAFSCSSKACSGTVTELVAYTDGRVSVRLDGQMVINGLSCNWLTLSGGDTYTPGYKSVSSALFMAHATGKELLIRVSTGTCNIQYVWFR